MKLKPLSQSEAEQAFKIPKKTEVVENQKLPVRYNVEDFDVKDRRGVFWRLSPQY